MNNFSIRDTNVCKGIAVLLLLYHHLFFSTDAFQGFSVSFFPLTQESAIWISNACKICVSIFVFLSGYGLSKSYSSKKQENAFQFSFTKHVKLIANFLIVFLLAFICCILFDGRNVLEVYGARLMLPFYMIMDAMGLARVLNFPTLNETWWYMAIAIFIIYAVPLLYRLIKKFNFSVYVVTVLGLILLNVDINSYLSLYLPTLILGIYTSENNVFEKIKKNYFDDFKFKKLFKCILMFGVILLVIILRQKLPNIVNICNSILAFLICFFCYIYMSKLHYVSDVLAFIGVHSMNIFLVHTFIKKYFMHSYIYSFKYSLLILLMLLIISLLVSLVINLVKKFIHFNKLINRLLDRVNNSGFLSEDSKKYNEVKL